MVRASWPGHPHKKKRIWARVLEYSLKIKIIIDGSIITSEKKIKKNIHRKLKKKINDPTSR
jgi:hypothetical protein